MGAVSFLFLAFLGGYGIAGNIKVIKEEENKICGRIAMGIGIGYLMSGWIAYIVSYFCKVVLKLENPKMYGCGIAMAVMLLMFAVTTTKSLLQGGTLLEIEKGKRFWVEALFFILLFAFIYWTMHYVFFMDGSDLRSGFTTFGDFSPHTAMIRSFSFHNNFPTQYPHYGGVDVKYHFMFQFYAGILEYLGMRIDIAFNLISAASLWAFLVMLYFFAKQLTGYTAAGVVSVLLFFCRSSFAGLDKLAQTVVSGDWESFLSNTEFIGYTAHEDWGLWNYNVFLNQRHLAFGLLIAIIVIMYFANYLNWFDKIEKEKPEKFTERIKTGAMTLWKNAFASKEAWLPENWKAAAAFGIMLGALSFWNGAVVIVALLILFGFAVFSKHKLDYLITAMITVVLAVIQTRFFMDNSTGQDINLRYCFGFLSDELTLPGAIIYILKLSGIFFVGILVFILLYKGKFKTMIFAFLLPVVFAFTVAMTPDIAVNHKYIIIATIFLNIFWAYAIVSLWKAHCAFKPVLKCIAVLLMIILTITGAYDILTIINTNKNTVSVDMDSELTAWLKDNLTEDDLILTGEDSMSETTLAGVMLYGGWPYYAWSAGYDTNTRAANAVEIYTSTNKEIVQGLVKKEGITYILYFEGLEYESHACTDEVIKELFQCVYDDGYFKIYKVS